MADKWQRVESRQEQDVRAAGNLIEPKILIRKLSMVWAINTETVISVLSEIPEKSWQNCGREYLLQALQVEGAFSS